MSFVLTGKAVTQQDTEYWSRFGFDACAMPCFAGMTPGETAFTRALDLIDRYIPALSEQVLISGSQTVFFGEDPITRSSITGIARYAQGKVGEIRLTITRPLVSVLLRFGTPDCALTYPPGDAEYLYLFWEDGELMHWASATVAENVRLNSSVFTIASTALEDDAVCSSNANTVPWRGFAPVWVYHSAAST